MKNAPYADFCKKLDSGGIEIAHAATARTRGKMKGCAVLLEIEKMKRVLALLELHRRSFYEAASFATETEHPVPSDTRAWSQILVSLVTGIKGLARKKGADLSDGSDVKAANLWRAIDTPRFNGCLNAGRKGVEGCIEMLDKMPYLFFVMWDSEPISQMDRCRIWAVRASRDPIFRDLARKWYKHRTDGTIRSNNCQLHPPRNEDTNIFRNRCGNLNYPLLFRADWNVNEYKAVIYDPKVLRSGLCSAVTD